MKDNTQREPTDDDSQYPNPEGQSERADAVDESLHAMNSAEESAEERIESLEADLDEANRRVLMAQADVENFRKRMRRDYEEQIRYAAVPLIRDLLEVRDNLQRALDASQSNEQAAGLREGVVIVAKQFEEVLQKHHCRPIPAEGELFDPNFHEAITQMASDTHAAGTVVHEATRGYQLYERVVRPSQVIVSTGPAE